MLHKPLIELVNFIIQLLTDTSIIEPPKKKEKIPFDHVTPTSRECLFSSFCNILLILLAALVLGEILWYKQRAGSNYCFTCSSTACFHLNVSQIKEDKEKEKDYEIEWKAWLAKCVDSSPLVVARQQIKRGNLMISFLFIFIHC